MLIVLTLGISTGANLVLFDAVRQLLFMPPEGVEDAERLALISTSNYVEGLGWRNSIAQSYPTYRGLINSAAFPQFAAYTDLIVSLGETADSREVGAALVDTQYFRTVGVHTAAGRFWDSKESTSPVAVVSYSAWKNVWRGDPTILGQQIRIDGTPFTIIGVAQQGFSGLSDRPMTVWLPLAAAASAALAPDWETNPHSAFLRVVARLSAGVKHEAASDRLNEILRARPELMPRPSTRAFATSLMEHRAREALQRLGRLLLGLSVLLFLAACAGAATFLIGQLAIRRQTLAIHIALGAPRSAVIRAAVARAVSFAAVATAIGGGMTVLAAHALQRWLLPTFAWREGVVRADLIAGSLVVILTITAAISAFELLATAQVSPSWLLARHGSERHTSVATWQLPALVVQSAVVFLLLAGVGLFGRTFRHLRSADLGFDAEHVLVLELDRRDPTFTAERAHLVYSALKEKLLGVASITSISRATSIPLDRSAATYIRVLDQNVQPLSTGGPYITGVDRNYFTTLGTPVVRGRTFSERDRGSSHVVVVNETMQRLAWQGRDPLGSCVYIAADPVCHTVVGVVQDTKRSQIREASTLQVFVPLENASVPLGNLALFMRTDAPASERTGTIMKFLRGSGRSYGRPTIQPLGDLVGAQVQEWRMTAIVVSTYGVLAFIVALMSVAGVCTLSFSQRRREFAVRRALGASHFHLALALSLRTIVAFLLGITAALAGIALIWSRIAPLLFGIGIPEIIVSLAVAGAAAGMIVLAGVGLPFVTNRISALEILRLS